MMVTRITSCFCLLIVIGVTDVLCETYYAERIRELVSIECINERKIDLEKSLNDFFICHANGLQTIQQYFHFGRIEPNMTEMCTQNSLKQCLTDFKDKLGACLSESHQKEFIEDPIVSLTHGLKFVCSENGYRVKEITNEKTKNCLGNKTKEIRQCNQKYHYIQEKWFILSFRTRGKWGTCLLEILDDCGDNIKEVVRGLLVAMIHPTPSSH
uniref:DUF19 domain-containing protein n=1 Tax=Strigamia maritima TaxID=126957 RepID=T1JDK4_STRMM